MQAWSEAPGETLTSPPHAVGLPVGRAEPAGLGGPDHQVLHVPPRQVHAARKTGR